MDTVKTGNHESTVKVNLHQSQEKIMIGSKIKDRIETIAIKQSQKKDMLLTGENRKGQERAVSRSGYGMSFLCRGEKRVLD